jgi:hypothetical protein
MTVPKILNVLNVGDRRRIGTIELTDDGELRAAPRGVEGMVDRMAQTRGWGPRQAFDQLNGWSNGYLQIVPAIPVARVFDGLEPGTGEPYIAPDHPIVHDTAQRERLATYLKAGRPILATTAHEIDRVDRSRGEAVPLSFRTDGAWIWTDAVTYYLEAHGLAPDPDLTAHIAAAGYECPPVDDATAGRALEDLYGPSSGDDGPVADSGESPAFTVSGSPAPPPIALRSPGGTLDVAPDLTPDEFEILERMRRGLDEPPGGA